MAFVSWFSRLVDDMTNKLRRFQIDADALRCRPPSPPSPPGPPDGIITPEDRRAFAEVFHRIDDSCDDEINFYELKSALGGLGFFPVTNDLVNRMLREADTSGDGKIDFEEFCQICKKVIGLGPEWARVQQRIQSDRRRANPQPPPSPPHVHFDGLMVGDRCHYRSAGGPIMCTILERHEVTKSVFNLLRFSN